MKLTAYYAAATNAVQVRLTTDAAPGGTFVKLIDIVHEPLDNLPGAEGRDVSHVIYQHVQEALYRLHGVQNMQLINITVGGNYKLLQRVFVDQGQNRLGYNIENTVTVTLDPVDATTDGITFTPSNPDLVTVVADEGDGVYTFKGTNKGEFFLKVRVGQFEQNIPFEFSDELEPAAVPVESVDLTPATLSVAVGATSQLTATVAPENANDQTVTYVSATPGVATVSASGLVTGVAAGTSVITVTTTDGAKTDTSTVTVTVNVESVTIAPTSASIAVAATQQLTPTVLPANATVKTVTYVSSNPAVATVNGSGLVTGVSAGTANITVTTTNGAKTAVSAITVTA